MKPKEREYDILRLRLGSKRFSKAADAPRVPLGQSRIGGPIIDWPSDWEELRPDEFFIAMLDLSWLTSFDKQKLLPTTGYLYFTCFGDYTGGARYFDGPKSALKRIVREHDGIMYEGVTVRRCENEKENLSEWYFEDGSWNYFAGMEKTKLFGVPADCQRVEREMLQVLKESVLLFQAGNDATGGGGCMIYMIPPKELRKHNFHEAFGQWGSS